MLGAIDAIVMGAFCLLFFRSISASILGLLVAPTNTVPNLTVFGLALSAAATGVGVIVGVGVALCVAVAVGVKEAVAVGVNDAVAVAVIVAVRDEVGVAVGLPWDVEVAVGVGVQSESVTESPAADRTRHAIVALLGDVEIAGSVQRNPGRGA